MGAVLEVLLCRVGRAEYESEEITCAQAIGAGQAGLPRQRNERMLQQSRRGARPSRASRCGGGFGGNEGPSSGEDGPGGDEPTREKDNSVVTATLNLL